MVNTRPSWEAAPGAVSSAAGSRCARDRQARRMVGCPAPLPVYAAGGASPAELCGLGCAASLHRFATNCTNAAECDGPRGCAPRAPPPPHCRQQGSPVRRLARRCLQRRSVLWAAIGHQQDGLQQPQHPRAGSWRTPPQAAASAAVPALCRSLGVLIRTDQQPGSGPTQLWRRLQAPEGWA